VRRVRAVSILQSVASSAIASLGCAVLAITMTSAAFAGEVYETSATMSWTPASGSVSAYAVFVSRNGGGFSVAPDQVVSGTQVRLQAAFGDTLVVRVAARDRYGNQGPYSPESDAIHFVVEPGVAMEAWQSSAVGTTPEGSKAAAGLFSITNTSTMSMCRSSTREPWPWP